jgi:pimeloyl-ACP methyl ester carboxylesterase
LKHLTRRQYLQALAAGIAGARFARAANANVTYGQSTLPAGIRSITQPNINGLTIHALEAGFEQPGRPCVLLLHGYPELAYSWRKVMLPIAAAGYHVIAPDARGYGRTTGGDTKYDIDLTSYSTLNLVRDAMGLLTRMGYKSVAAVIGHDAGSPVAAWCAVARPDVFRSVAMMSAPFGGTPAIAAGTPAPPRASLDAQLAALPRPRKYYQQYYATREANGNMHDCPQGIHAFMRAYYHYKSADWKGNKPHPLKSNSGEEMAQMPTYYVMDRAKGMAETVAEVMPGAAEIAACKWLTDEELKVYSSEYGRTGFQGGLQGYRRGQDPRLSLELQTFAGRTIDVPSIFIAGKSDWGVYQGYGAFERMQSTACTHMKGAHLIDGAGHWVMQEQPEEVSRLLVEFLRA